LIALPVLGFFLPWITHMGVSGFDAMISGIKRKQSTTGGPKKPKCFLDKWHLTWRAGCQSFVVPSRQITCNLAEGGAANQSADDIFLPVYR
jgi:hypothetical protein